MTTTWLWFVIAAGLLLLALARFAWFRQVLKGSLPGSGKAIRHTDTGNGVDDHTDRMARLFMAIFVSLVVLGCAVYLILHPGSSEAEQKWAFGSVGAILGYWLRGGA